MEEELKELNAECDALVSQIDEMYIRRDQCLGDPGAYYDVCWDIERAENRIDYLADRIANLVEKQRAAQADGQA